jgi:D-alanyl-D-alanine carboxypeptidase (penicillin-binding protein 5/6)
MQRASGRRGRLAAAVAAVGAVLLLAGLLIPSTAPEPAFGAGGAGASKQGTEAPKPPELPASAWILIDARDGSELAGSNESETLPIASTTKLMTAYLTLQRYPLGKLLTAPGYAALPAESVLGLQKGERMSVRDLMTAMMLPSANDAAYALAEDAAGSIPAFVAQMNRAAARLGLDDTRYATPIGLDDPDNGSSARDLAALARRLMRDERFRKIVGQSSATLETGAMPRTVETRNTLMLADPSVTGIKTGHTLGAGYVLVASAERKGVPLISVVLGTSSEAERDAASEQLLDYGFDLYGKRTAVDRGEELGTLPVTEGDPKSLSLEAGKPFRITARRDQDLEVSLDAPPAVAGPIAAGERIGVADVLLDGEQVGRVPALAAAGIAEETMIDKLGGPVAALLIAGGGILLLIGLVAAMRRKAAAS